MIRPTLLFCIALALQLGAAVEECDDNSIGKTLQDPEDCHGFYLCHSGHKLQQYCAPGMKYEPQLGTCRIGKCPPCNCAVDPTSTTTPEPTESSTDSSTAASTTTPEPTESSTDSSTAASTTTPEPTESSTDSSTAASTTTPEPTESSTDSSTAASTTTPEPTESSTDSSTAASTTTPEPTDSTTTPEPTESTTTPQPSESTSTSEDPTTTSAPRPPVSCENIRDGSFFRDPVHCRDYYVCRNRQPVLLHCEKGMWFDDKKFVCNYPSLVDCPSNID